MLKLCASNWLIGDVDGESVIFSSSVIHNTAFSLTGVVGVLNRDNSERPKTRLSMNIIPQPTINAASAAQNVFQKFIIYEILSVFFEYTTAKI
jgi:hypothetical protein